ncbi:unnamed protein product, partial [Allacma fusca]
TKTRKKSYIWSQDKTNRRFKKQNLFQWSAKNFRQPCTAKHNSNGSRESNKLYQKESMEANKYFQARHSGSVSTSSTTSAGTSTSSTTAVMSNNRSPNAKAKKIIKQDANGHVVLDFATSPMQNPPKEYPKELSKGSNSSSLNLIKVTASTTVATVTASVPMTPISVTTRARLGSPAPEAQAIIQSGNASEHSSLQLIESTEDIVIPVSGKKGPVRGRAWKDNQGNYTKYICFGDGIEYKPGGE